MAMGFKPTQFTQRFCRPSRLFHFGEPSDQKNKVCLNLFDVRTSALDKLYFYLKIYK